MRQGYDHCVCFELEKNYVVSSIAYSYVSCKVMLSKRATTGESVLGTSTNDVHIFF